ncbi:outer membrane lipoprotein-sorting protein [Chitinispirillales bacterium ANBcel5]|uniref:outer membrane lipoprotein-sorting protein n=1 Tax=Cellulosispirillum alkaliphilum TaxID=3039283 RepID=UPI002A503F06|nr:outer membrane lipoprotein-sorting protein [Chitinispirillales bacterium ANBcel5]
MYLKLATLIGITAFSSFALTVDEILDKAEANQNPQTSRSEVTQTVIQANGRENVSRLVSYSMNEGEKSLMEYIEPARIRGMKILMLNDGDDIWFYSPRTSRVRRIASHQRNQSINNSDFSYEDLSPKDMRENYTVTLKGEETIDGVNCYKLLALPKTDDVSYAKTISWIDKERFIPVKMHFFDEDNTLWKKLTVDSAQKVGEYWSFNRVTMKDLLRGSKTIMEMDKIENDITIDENMFSERYLSR